MSRLIFLATTTTSLFQIHWSAKTTCFVAGSITNFLPGGATGRRLPPNATEFVNALTSCAIWPFVITHNDKARFSSGRVAAVPSPAAGSLLWQPRPVTAQNIKITDQAFRRLTLHISPSPLSSPKAAVEG